MEERTMESSVILFGIWLTFILFGLWLIGILVAGATMGNWALFKSTRSQGLFKRKSVQVIQLKSRILGLYRLLS